MIITIQIMVTSLLLIVLCLYASLIVRGLKLRRLFSKDYIKVIQTNRVRRLYPFVPRWDSPKHKSTKRFLTSVGWRMSVEEIYMLKWLILAVTLFVLTTIQTTNSSIELKEILRDVNYRHNLIDNVKVETEQNYELERKLFSLADKSLAKGDELHNKENKQMYVEYIESLVLAQGDELGESPRNTAERLYSKLLQTRMIRKDVVPYIYIFLASMLLYYMPDILGQIKRKLIEDKKNWEILNCMIIFSIFGRMPPFSVMTILEHMIIATEVYKPLLEALAEGLKKGGNQEEAFDAALSAVDRDELYELIEIMKLARRTGLINSVTDVDDAIENTIKWIEIENITRRRTKLLYALSAMAVVMGLGCIYFAYGLTVIANPANMLIK